MLALVVVCIYACFADAQVAPPPAEQTFSFVDKPLRVCTASIQNWGARCNGGPTELYRGAASTIPQGGWCGGRDFCGYDVDVWRYELCLCYD